MVDSVFTSAKTFKPGMLARLKVTPQAKATLNPGLSRAEQQLSDTLKLSDEAKSRVMQGRKLDSYLRVFSSALKIFNGYFSAGYKPVQSKVDIEFIEMPKPGIDKKI